VIRLHCFLAEVAGGQPQAIECSDWRWVEPQEMGNFSFPPASGLLIEALQKKRDAPFGDTPSR